MKMRYCDEKLFTGEVLSSLSFSSCPVLSPDTSSSDDKFVIFPGFVDVHVHLREPGFSYKETIYSGSRACARGGYTHVCSMPNLNPVPDCIESLRYQTEIIERDSVIDVLPYGSITKGESGEELSDMLSLAPLTVAFSDDGRGVQSAEIMEKAMLTAKTLGRVIAAHCEDNSLLYGGYIHKGKYAEEHGHKGISSESEWKQIERDLSLAKKTGCAYHVCHISSKESVSLIRDAKRNGIDVTCETAPHYLLLDDSDIKEEGRYKMNPPLRDKTDREALIEGIKDGTIDMISTDHAPHSSEEKSKGLENSLFGIVGIETAFPLLYTYLVKEKIISLNRLLELICYAPAKRFGIQFGDDFTVFNLNDRYKIRSDEFLSKGKSTPFENTEVFGRCLLTVSKGRAAYTDAEYRREK